MGLFLLVAAALVSFLAATPIAEGIATAALAYLLLLFRMQLGDEVVNGASLLTGKRVALTRERRGSLTERPIAERSGSHLVTSLLVLALVLIAAFAFTKF